MSDHPRTGTGFRRADMTQRRVRLCTCSVLAALAVAGPAWAAPAVMPSREASSPVGVEATSAEETGAVEISLNADGEVTTSAVSADYWLTDVFVDDLNPLLAYVAGFATFSGVLGAGMKGVLFWKETR